MKSISASERQMKRYNVIEFALCKFNKWELNKLIESSRFSKDSGVDIRYLRENISKNTEEISVETEALHSFYNPPERIPYENRGSS